MALHAEPDSSGRITYPDLLAALLPHLSHLARVSGAHGSTDLVITSASLTGETLGNRYAGYVVECLACGSTLYPTTDTPQLIHYGESRTACGVLPPEADEARLITTTVRDVTCPDCVTEIHRPV